MRQTDHRCQFLQAAVGTNPRAIVLLAPEERQQQAGGEHQDGRQGDDRVKPVCHEAFKQRERQELPAPEAEHADIEQEQGNAQPFLFFLYERNRNADYQ